MHDSRFIRSPNVAKPSLNDYNRIVSTGAAVEWGNPQTLSLSFAMF